MAGVRRLRKMNHQYPPPKKKQIEIETKIPIFLSIMAFLQPPPRILLYLVVFLISSAPANAITKLQLHVIGANRNNDKVLVNKRQVFSVDILFDLFRGDIASQVSFSLSYDDTELLPISGQNLFLDGDPVVGGDLTKCILSDPNEGFGNGCNYTYDFNPPKQLPQGAGALPLYRFVFLAFNPDSFPGDGEADVVAQGTWTRNPTETLDPVSIEVIEEVPGPLPILGAVAFACCTRRMKKRCRRLKSSKNICDSD
jgi:hypothetical protein